MFLSPLSSTLLSLRLLFAVYGNEYSINHIVDLIAEESQHFSSFSVATVCALWDYLKQIIFISFCGDFILHTIQYWLSQLVSIQCPVVCISIVRSSIEVLLNQCLSVSGTSTLWPVGHVSPEDSMLAYWRQVLSKWGLITRVILLQGHKA